MPKVFLSVNLIERLKNEGGQNPIDAAKLLQLCVICNFKEIYDFFENQFLKSVIILI